MIPNSTINDSYVEKMLGTMLIRESSLKYT